MAEINTHGGKLPVSKDVLALAWDVHARIAAGTAKWTIKDGRYVAEPISTEE